MQSKKRIRFLTESAAIAALYVALTWLSALFGLAIGPIEFRLSEALVVLPMFTSAAVPGLFGGCVLANLLCGGAVPDIVFGSLATLLGALGTYYFRKHKLLPYLFPIAANTAIVPWILLYVYGFGAETPKILFFLTFLAGEAASVGIFGSLLKKALSGREKLFR